MNNILLLEDLPEIRRWLKAHGREGRFVVLTEGPSRKRPDRNNSMEIIDLNA